MAAASPEPPMVSPTPSKSPLCLTTISDSLGTPRPEGKFVFKAPKPGLFATVRNPGGSQLLETKARRDPRKRGGSHLGQNSF